MGRYGVRMGALTVLYDGGCGICVRLAGHVATRTGVSVVPIDSELGAVLLRDLSPAERAASVHVVDDRGRRRSGGAALPPLLRQLPHAAVLAAAAERLPGLADRCYRLVAHHRRTLSRLARLEDCGATAARPVAGCARTTQRRHEDGPHPSPPSR
ncbi:hypothetical protein Gocc_2772 [Gaiella occulta]|uniref:DUF393 domain-containing protein n=2 Tax=Gaiella occulta TaxID=1002870 RepID=A0A7M2YTK4_9ACTN|nr:hypothetical protein Gocc_2772 [Gaiella occulta]